LYLGIWQSIYLSREITYFLKESKLYAPLQKSFASFKEND